MMINRSVVRPGEALFFLPDHLPPIELSWLASVLQSTEIVYVGYSELYYRTASGSLRVGHLKVGLEVGLEVGLSR